MYPIYCFIRLYYSTVLDGRDARAPPQSIRSPGGSDVAPPVHVEKQYPNVGHTLYTRVMVSRELEERSVRTIIIIIITVVSPPDRGDLELLSTVSDVIPHRRRRRSNNNDNSS